jgi:hypothetical protein
MIGRLEKEGQATAPGPRLAIESNVDPTTREVSSMNARSQAKTIATTAFERGQRLYCRQCGSEIEILAPCPCDPPDQNFRCCGEPMRPTTDVAVHVNSEA